MDEEPLSTEQALAVERAIQLKEAAKPKRKKFRWRIFNRALHRDLGALAFGLTLIYAISGIALHHLESDVVNPKDARKEFVIPAPFAEDTQEFIEGVVELANAETMPDRIFPATAEDRSRAEAAGGDWTLEWGDGRMISIEPSTGQAVERWSEGNSLITTLNWLHAARGKPGWWAIGDIYGVILVVLAISGLMMIPRKKLMGRAGLFIVIGMAVPFIYVMRELWLP